MNKTYYMLLDDYDNEAYELLAFDVEDTEENKRKIQESIWEYKHEYEKLEEENRHDEMVGAFPLEHVLNRLIEHYDCKIIPWDNENKLYV